MIKIYKCSFLALQPFNVMSVFINFTNFDNVDKLDQRAKTHKTHIEEPKTHTLIIQR